MLQAAGGKYTIVAFLMIILLLDYLDCKAEQKLSCFITFNSNLDTPCQLKKIRGLDGIKVQPSGGCDFAYDLSCPHAVSPFLILIYFCHPYPTYTIRINISVEQDPY